MTPTYLNPVHRSNFPDPFVLKHGGEYWAYGTDFARDGRAFGILRSRDLVHWEAVGGALEPLAGDFPCYWAPEVAYLDGRFYLYYSVGDEATMEIRVAVAAHPAGPFMDSGRRLTREPFAIDAHLFEDDDGARYLFYATDFLEHARVGTGTVVDRLLDPFTLAGEPRPVTRARHDWQIYDPQRPEKGGVRWHTVEGSFVVKRKGLYYQMFSGGNWTNPTYGVSYATTDRLNTSDEWEQHCDGERILPILRTLPGQVIGPGHNSAVRGPDNQQQFCVYHRWAADGSGREMAIDPLDWAGERMLVLGPSTTPQPAPTPPTFSDFFDTPRDGWLGPTWECEGGQWAVRDGTALQRSNVGYASAGRSTGATSFVAEVSLRALDAESGAGECELCLYGEYGWELSFGIAPQLGHAVIAWPTETGPDQEQRLPLSKGFDASAFHGIRVEVDGLRVALALDGVAARWQGQLAVPATGIGLCTQGMAAAFAGFALTVGWEERFEGDEADPAARGWVGGGAWRVRDGQLWHEAEAAAPALLTKGPLLENYEWVINGRLLNAAGSYGFGAALDANGRGPLWLLAREGEGWTLQSSDGSQTFPLPATFDPFEYQQFRFRKQAGRLTVQWEAETLGEVEVSTAPTQVGLVAQRAPVAFDMARVTALPA